MDSSTLYGDSIAIYGDGVYFSDDEEAQDEFWEALTGKKRSKKKKSTGGPRVPRQRAASMSKAASQHMITAYNSDQGLFLRKKKVR